MYILVNAPSNSVLVNLENTRHLVRRNDRLVADNATTILQSQETEPLKKRFADIVAALESGKVKVYDVDKDVGYWNPKPKPKPKPKSTPKPPAEGA